MNAIVLREDEALNPLEYGILQECESRIEKGLATFIEVGTALLEIRDSRLYREQYRTFEEYCRERWQKGSRWAYQLIEAATVVENVRNCAQILPMAESQARPLVALEPEEQRTVWELAVAAADTMKEAVTAAIVAASVEVVQQQQHDLPAGAKAILDTKDPQVVQEVIQEYTAQKAISKQSCRQKRIPAVLPAESPLITDDSWRGPTSRAEEHAIWLWSRMKDFEREGHMVPGARVIYNHLTEEHKRDMARLIKPILKFLHELEVLL